MIREKNSYFIKPWINQNHHNFEYFISMLDDKNHFCHSNERAFSFDLFSHVEKMTEKRSLPTVEHDACAYSFHRDTNYHKTKQSLCGFFFVVKNHKSTHSHYKTYSEGIVDEGNRSNRPAAPNNKRKNCDDDIIIGCDRKFHFLHIHRSHGGYCCYYCYYCRSRSHCHLQLAVVGFCFPYTVIRNDTISLRFPTTFYILRHPDVALPANTQWHTKFASVTYILWSKKSYRLRCACGRNAMVVLPPVSDIRESTVLSILRRKENRRKLFRFLAFRFCHLQLQYSQRMLPLHYFSRLASPYRHRFPAFYSHAIGIAATAWPDVPAFLGSAIDCFFFVVPKCQHKQKKERTTVATRNHDHMFLSHNGCAADTSGVC